jgi:hypothetical protein
VALALASHFDARRLVFVDESGFHTSMTRLRARAPKGERGERAYGKVPRNPKAREHYAHRCDHSRRSHGRVDDRRGSHRL